MTKRATEGAAFSDSVIRPVLRDFVIHHSNFAILDGSVQFKLSQVLLPLSFRNGFLHPLFAQEKIFEDQRVHVSGQETAVGEQTIGSPRTLKLVLTRTAQPVWRSKAFINR